MVVVICYTKIQLFFIPTTIYIKKIMNSYFFPVSNEERENILDKHKHVYNGYRTLNPNPVANEQPLYTQDFANDKEGLVVNNKGEVKAYTNMGINESRKRKPYVEMDEELCEQCGGKMYEDVCEQCSGKMNEDMCEQCGEMEEDLDIGDVASSVEPAYQFQSHGPEDVYGTLKDYDSEHPHHDYDSMEDVEKYDPSDDLSSMFGELSDGMAFGGGPSDTFQHDAGDVDREGDEGLGQDTENDMDLSNVKPAYDFESDGALNVYEDDVEEEVDEDLKESFSKQRNLTLEMFQRMGKFL
jgi:RecJ-like exonuclease